MLYHRSIRPTQEEHDYIVDKLKLYLFAGDLPIKILIARMLFGNDVGGYIAKIMHQFCIRKLNNFVVVYNDTELWVSK